MVKSSYLQYCNHMIQMDTFMSIAVHFCALGIMKFGMSETQLPA